MTDPFQATADAIAERSFPDPTSNAALAFSTRFAGILRVATPILAGVTAAFLTRKLTTGALVGIGTFGLVVASKRLAEEG